MNFRDCINRATAAGFIDGDRAAGLEEAHNRMTDAMRAEFGYTEAARRAAEEVINTLQRSAAKRKQRVVLSDQVLQARLEDMAAYRNGDDPGWSIAAMVEQDPHSPFMGMENRRRALMSEAYSTLDEFMAETRPTFTGGRRGERNDETLTRALFEESVNDPAIARMADGFLAVRETLRQRLNAAGADLAKLDTYGLRMSHDVDAMRKAGRDAWVEAVRPRLDRTRIIHPITKEPVADTELDGLLGRAYDAIVSDGWSTRDPSRVPQRRRAQLGDQAQRRSFTDPETEETISLQWRESAHRVLVFKDGGEWLAHAREYGQANPVAAIHQELDQKIRLLAELETLGPNPEGTLAYLRGVAEKWASEPHLDAATARRRTSRVRSAADRTDDMLAHYRLALSPVHDRLAVAGASLRGYLTGTLLGSASISAVAGDLATYSVMRLFNGMRGGRAVKEYFRLWRAGSVEDRQALQRAGVMMEAWMDRALVEARFVGEMFGSRTVQRYNATIFNLTGLTRHTAIAREAVQVEIMANLATWRELPFDRLNRGIQRMMRRHGVTPADWDAIRSAPPRKWNDIEILAPGDVLARPDGDPTISRALSLKLRSLMASEAELAVPGVNLRTHAWLKGNSRPGTLFGEIRRAAAMFKSFPVTILMRNVATLMTEGTRRGAAWVSLFFAANTLGGAIAFQAKEVSKGRDPLDMSTAKFWGQAALQGGAMGILGDFLFSNVNRFGSGMGATLAGPPVGFLSDAWDLTGGNLLEAAAGEDTRVGAESIRFANRYGPGTSIFYLRLGLQRLLFDNLATIVDPDGAARLQRMERRYYRDRNQSFWFRPGESLPSRAPDISAVAGGSTQ